jgi:molecular chaperone DnaK (HSP70)
MAQGVRLGIDFGTFNTVAMISRADTDPRPLLFDGSPLLPSAVLLEGPGDVLAGADAVRSARLYPDRYEPNPKRRMADGIVLLGGHETDVVDLVSAVLGRVAVEARKVTGQVPDRVVVTHPEIWGTSRRRRLTESVARAGLPTPKLVSEPVAAAAYFLTRDGATLERCAVVYDFGAGTFDAGVVRRGPDGALTVLASEGLPELGGLDLDAALVEHLGQQIAQRDRDAWDRLRHPATAADRRARWQLWEDTRLAKESLSRRSQTMIHLPVVDESVPITREEFERLAEPIIARTVAVTRAAVRSAGIEGDGTVGGIFLVGGSSRVPLVATLLHRAFGLPPTVLEQPELVVAEGALSLLDAHEEVTAAGVTMTLPVTEPTAPPVLEEEEPTAEGPVGPRERTAVGRYFADPWGIGAAAVLGTLAAVVALSTGSRTATAFAAAAVVAIVVYVVRVVLGLVFKS